MTEARFELLEGAAFLEVQHLLVAGGARFSSVTCDEHAERGHVRGCGRCRAELAKTIDHVREIERRRELAEREGAPA